MVNSAVVKPGLAQAPRFDVQTCRNDFPALHQEVSNGCPLIYLDSAATSLKPETVVRAVADYLAMYPANVHRGLHTLSERATEAFEGAREKVARFLNTDDSGQIIFTRGTTESINLVAQSWGRTFLKSGDEIVLSDLEHHSNLVPWQMVARERGATLRFAELTRDCRLTEEAVAAVMSDRVRLVAVTGMSNVTGSMPPLAAIVGLARSYGARVVIDAAQSMPHHRLDVSRLGADFAAFSGHKMCGPTGIGVLYAKRELLEAMPPVLAGGSMVTRVTRERAEWNEVPWKFEGGTPPIAEAIGLGAAIDYLSQFSPAALAAHERSLIVHAHEVLGQIEGLRIYGPTDPTQKGAIASFTLEGTHPHDLAQLLDRHGIAIRAGHHCAMPLHLHLGIPASARASLYLYNTLDEVDRLAEALESIKTLFRRRVSPPAAPRTLSPIATEPSNG
ncbi:MAG: aminotransferase class V-fold PLP-dependent enzyme [Isosphaeraceae bacterium]